MNPVRKGFERDRRIVDLVERLKALDTDQVAALLFRFPSGRRQAQERLRRLHERDRLKRCALDRHRPLVYYLDRRGEQLQHALARNWVYVWLASRLPWWETLTWETEPDYGIVRPDAFAGIHNKVAGTWRFYFVEIDRGHDPWDKTAKYGRLFSEERYAGWWWVAHTSTFPPVLCVAETPTRARVIQRDVGEKNVHGLRFDVRLLSDLRREAMCWKRD